ncbi:MAG: helix-turn-helix domain-containing protein, partial [Candidatus Delongbacteria bacterium]|nr:helix-turn-helix domain-containing protein [Candidatus Delongbacteria bacterium]
MKSRAKKYTPEFREKTVKLALITDIKSASAFYQLNRKTVGKWVNLYRKEGDASYGYRKKRNDKQKKKISNIVLKRIIKFKKDNPKVTLENIKQEFCLDCSLTTIAKKLKKYSRNKTGTNEQVLTISYNILKHSRFKGEIKKIYQFNMFDSLTKNQYIGFSTERNIKNFCIFIYYVISQLKKLEYLSNNVKIVTSLKYLEQLNEHKSEYGKTIFTNFKIPIVIEKNTSLNNLNVNKISSSFSKEELMVSAYETTIMCNGNTILIHPINIDAHLADSNKIDYLCVSPSFSSELLSLSLEKIEYYGDQARAKYDLDKAKLLYGKIYLTTLQYTCSKGKTLKIKSLYKRAIIFYHTDDYKTAKELLLQVLNLSKNCQNSFQIGYIYYHLGMIHMIENNQKLSEDNLSFAINEFLQSPQKKFLLDYFKANVKKYAYMGHFDTALRYAHKYVKSAKYQKNEKQVCEAYDTRGKVYFRKAKYKYAEKDYLRQMEIAHKSS